ncbi:MAG: hypothetical protein IPF64_14610 [Flavobacteriales bacterium]|nr:hypothetical protein [Flavobacteriales bacterium]
MSYATRYAEIKAYNPHGLRGTLRNVALDGLATAYQVGGRMERALQRPRVQFLYIHHTFTDELAGLERLIKDLARHHSFISHSEAVERVRNGTIDKPYIAFSSDDGFKNNLDGGRLLHAHGISACFFVNPGLIGGFESCASAERGCHIGNGAVPSNSLCLRRDHVVLDWPLGHVRYFLANNALNANAANNLFPA